MATHIMVDLETWGTTPGSDIRSIGAVVFDPVAGTLGHEFYINVNTPWWNRLPFRRSSLRRDPATKAWWAQQSRHAQEALLVDQVRLRPALQLFSEWWQGIALGNYGTVIGVNELRFWAHGPHFDEQILAACYRAIGMPMPWRYRAARDLRTILEAASLDPKNDIPDYGTAHNALDDAKAQALGVIHAYRIIRGSADARRDLHTHYGSWSKAISLAYENAIVRESDLDDKAYWNHEQNALDRVCDALAVRT